MNRRLLWGWLTVAGILLACTVIVLVVTGGFENPVATADSLREIGQALMVQAGYVVQGGTFSVEPWMDLIDDVGSFLDRAGFAKDELRATVRALGRYAEIREDRDRDLADWHYRRFREHLSLLEQGL